MGFSRIQSSEGTNLSANPAARHSATLTPGQRSWCRCAFGMRGPSETFAFCKPTLIFWHLGNGKNPSYSRTTNATTVRMEKKTWELGCRFHAQAHFAITKTTRLSQREREREREEMEWKSRMTCTFCVHVIGHVLTIQIKARDECMLQFPNDQIFDFSCSGCTSIANHLDMARDPSGIEESWHRTPCPK